jgi:acyl-CoA synthetase (AMP-forming)/AMP-acid ligase II
MSELSFEPLTPSSLRARSALLERFAALGIEITHVIAQRARVVVFRDELARTATGKAQKFQLRERLQGALTARAQTKR